MTPYARQVAQNWVAGILVGAFAGVVAIGVLALARWARVWPY